MTCVGKRSQSPKANTLTSKIAPAIPPSNVSSEAPNDTITYTIARSEVIETLNQMLYRTSHASPRAPHPDMMAAHRQGQGSNEQSANPSHEKTLAALADSAFLCEKQGRFSEAESLYQKVIALRHQQFGESHPSVAQHLSELAALYQSQNRYGEAEPLLQRSLKIRLQCLLADHPDIAENCYQLANVYRYQHRYDKAEPMFQCALNIFRQRFGSEHPHTKVVYDDLMHMIAIVIKTGRYSDIVANLPPLDLDNLSDRYPWARPHWHRPSSH